MATDPERIGTFHGRIDNADELRTSLGLAAGDRRDGARLALAAYDKWGADFCAHIVGDFACAIWDMRHRRLTLAVDPSGLRSLFFWENGERLLFASEQHALWTDPEVPREPSAAYMATWLVVMPRDPFATFFRDIARVAPGHRAIWEAGRVRIERWWRPETLPMLRLKRDADYEEALRDMLERAVACRIDTEERIGSHLSGGLDSSTVTTIAARQLAARGQRLTAFTSVPSHPVPDTRLHFMDEGAHAALVAERHRNIDHVRVATDDAPLLDALAWREMGSDYPFAMVGNVAWTNAIDRTARERNIRVMLTGHLGNLTISHDGDMLLSARLRRGDLVGAVQTAVDLRRRGGRSWLGIADEAAFAFLPVRMRRAVRAALGKPGLRMEDSTVIRPEFARRFDIEERVATVGGGPRDWHAGDSRGLRLQWIQRGEHRGQLAASTRRLFGIDLRDPTADRRLIELCLTIPDEQFAKNGVPRSLIRRVMKDVLPDAVLNERRRGRQAADWRVSFHAALPALREEVARLRNSAFASACLDLDKMDTLLDAWPGPGDRSERTRILYLMAFSRGLTAGRFIRRVEGGNA